MFKCVHTLNKKIQVQTAVSSFRGVYAEGLRPATEHYFNLTSTRIRQKRAGKKPKK